MDLSESLTIRLDTFGTALCSLFSLIGSIIVIFSYLFVKTISERPRAARIIFNLSLADCIWFSASFIQSCFWLFAGSYGQPGNVPVSVCYVCSPLVSLSRISSLLWTCVIAFETIQSVKSRTWYSQESQQLRYYDNLYLCFVYFFSIPGALLAIVKQHSGEHTLGCEPGYERLGEWYEIVFTELIPIIGGFLFNIYAYFQVKSKLSTRAFPRSVRKRRKRVMYHYIIVCLLCWCPTILFYILELFGVHRPLLEVVSRVSLYTTGFFNFLVFGMQDPHLSRSLRKLLHFIGLGYFVGVSNETNLTRSAFEKTVMFENAQKTNADIAKDKKTVYRYHRLSKDERLHLYKIRPDLDLKSAAEPLLDEHDLTAATEAVNESSQRDGGSGGRNERIQSTLSVENENDLGHDFSNQPRESSAFDESELIPTNTFGNSLRNIDGKMIRKDNSANTTPSGMMPFKIGSDELIASPFHGSNGNESPRQPQNPPSPSTTRRPNSDHLPLSVQERIQSLSTGYIGPNSQIDSFPDVEGGVDDESKSVNSRGRLVLDSTPVELTEGDSIFAADDADEEESSSSEEGDEEEQNDIVGSILSWVF